MSDIFIEGEIINLSIVDIEENVINGQWHSWFNDEKVTKYLYHGIYPNTKEEQVNITNSTLKQTNSVLLTITEKSTNKLLGVISFKNIDLINKVAEIGLVMGSSTYPIGSPLEAMSLMTAYGFEKLNLNQIKAGQHIGLWKWVNQLELLGYKLEGYMQQTYLQNRKYSDSVRVGISADEFFKIKKLRNDKYLTDDLPALLKKRRKENMCEKLKNAIDNIYQESQVLY